VLRERRSAERQSFCRPVTIHSNRRDVQDHLAFSRDISPHGIGLVDRYEWIVGCIADLEIHSLLGKNYIIRAEARWCEPYGKDWFLTGWSFLDEK
jgi:hypothetical protein